MSTSNLEILFLGSGAAFTTGGDNYQSNILLRLGDTSLLVDCGSDIRFSLFDQGLNYDSAQDVYISHLHADHVFGLEWLGFNRKFNSSLPKPVLHLSNKIVKKIWANVLSGAMSSLENEVSTLESFFSVYPIGKENYFHWQGIKFNLVRTVHSKNNRQLNPSFGLFWVYAGQRIFLTTDTQFCAGYLMDYYRKADLIFHDCETSKVHSGVHAHYNELLSLDPTIKNKMWLYHYNPGVLPEADKAGFKGFVKKGQSFVISSLNKGD